MFWIGVSTYSGEKIDAGNSYLGLDWSLSIFSITRNPGKKLPQIGHGDVQKK